MDIKLHSFLTRHCKEANGQLYSVTASPPTLSPACYFGHRACLDALEKERSRLHNVIRNRFLSFVAPILATVPSGPSKLPEYSLSPRTLFTSKMSLTPLRERFNFRARFLVPLVYSPFCSAGETEMKLVIKFQLWRAHPFTFSKASWICIWNTGNAQAARSALSVVISVIHSDRRLLSVPYSLCCGFNT